MFTESAELYDLIYSTIRDYGAEAEQVDVRLRDLKPNCRTILDVACGTGEHARLLEARFGYKVDGLDLSPAFVSIAHRKLPGRLFVVGDMAAFHLERRYDAVICLGSSIGYLLSLETVQRALECFRAHLSDDGVLIVEPWLSPEQLESGYRSTRTVESPTVKVVREQTTELVGRVSRLRFDYTIESHGRTRRTTELHELGLFTVAELQSTFAAAGLQARHDPYGLNGRGLFVASIAA